MRLLLDKDRQLYSHRFRHIYRKLFGVYMDDRNFIRKHFVIEKTFDIDAECYLYFGTAYIDIEELESYSPRTLIGCWILSQYITDSKMTKRSLLNV